MQKEEKEKTDEIRRLESEVKRLKVTISDLTFECNALESLIVVVDRHYQTDVKKNFGSKLSAIVGKKKEKV